MQFDKSNAICFIIYMTKFVTLTTQSQINMPALFRRQLGFKKGDTLRAEVSGDALVLRPAGDIVSLAGSLFRLAKKARTVADIRKQEEKAIEEAIADRYLSTLSPHERNRITKTHNRP